MIVSEKEPRRTDRMYDEHVLPREGIEQAIMASVGLASERSIDEVFTGVRDIGDFKKSDVTEGVWGLIDRGYIELTAERKLIGHEKPIYPAPCDLL